jgi:hypothetical protein
MGRAALTEVVAVLLHLLDVVLGQHGRRVPHGFPSYPYDPPVAAVKLAGGGLVRMEEGKGTRWHETPIIGPHIRHRRVCLPATATEHSLAYVSWASLLTGLERSNYAGLLPFPFLLPWDLGQPGLGHTDVVSGIQAQSN